MSATKQTTVVITGASRGIGLGLVELYAKDKAFRVIGTARTPAKADKLNAIAKANSNVSVVALDVADSKSNAALPAALTAAGVTTVDVLINNAGIGSDPFLNNLDIETVENFLTIYRTNVIGVWEVTKHLLPFLRNSAAAKVLNVSSFLGSVELTLTGPIPGLAPSYRASKAALNELTAVQAREYNNASVTASKDAKTAASAAPLISFVSINPGWVDTDMGNSTGQKAPVSVTDSTTGIAKVVADTKPNPIAVFVEYTGKPQPW